jgi:hypothetical protein
VILPNSVDGLPDPETNTLSSPGLDIDRVFRHSARDKAFSMGGMASKLAA